MGRVLDKVNKNGLMLLRRNPLKFWLNVTEINEGAFCGADKLFEIEIPSAVSLIGHKAFFECRNLQKALLNEGLKEIDVGAFSNCISLKEIQIPKSVKTINSSAFDGCFNLEQVTLKEGLVEILGEAFKGCKKLKNIEIPNTVKIINMGCFYGCSNLEQVIFLGKIERISESAFAFCENLKEIEMPKNLDEICSCLLKGCVSLNKVVLKEGIGRICDGAFSGCVSLKNINIPNTVEMIGAESFKGCSSLAKIKLPDNLEKIGDNAFAMCKNLLEIELPNNLINFGKNVFDYDVLKYLIVKDNGKIAFSSVNDKENYKETYLIEDILKVIPNLDVSILINNYSKIKGVANKARRLRKQGIVIPFSFIKSYEDLVMMCGKDYKVMKSVFKLIPNEIENVDLVELYNLCQCLGIFNKNDVNIIKNGNEVSSRDVAFTILQSAFNKGYLKFNELHLHFQNLLKASYNEQFLKFVDNKTNFNELMQEEENKNGFITRVYEWFEERKNLNLASENNASNGMPWVERDRYKLRTYETSRNGTDKIRWKVPTVSLLKREFLERKFAGIIDDRSREIAEYLNDFNLYTQKHFDKALEIDGERIESGVRDHLTNKRIKEDIIDSLEDYKKRTRYLKEEIIDSMEKTANNQVDTASKIFTYEMLAKSDKANFAMGLLTNCCATLYGAGAGAQRAMIIHPDIQPLVVRDIRGDVVAFGLIYVNKEEGYAVVNNFEVNKKYFGKHEELKEIYIKAMQGLDAFIKQYNKENEKQINLVTCGLSQNWEAINNYIKNNPESKLLDAPDFDDFMYIGSGSWSGDWFNEQYIIWENKENKKIR